MKKFYFFLIIIFLSIISSQVIASVLSKDEYYMRMAIKVAKQNPRKPFGAVIVDNKTGKILASGVNSAAINPTYHGEMVAINNCAKKYPHLDWKNVTLYTTAEPCPMCQSAIVWARISRMVFGTSMEYLIAHGVGQIKIHAAEINSKASFYKGTITGGVLANETNKLFKKLKF